MNDFHEHPDGTPDLTPDGTPDLTLETAPASPGSPERRRGFTLIEIMAVVIIMGLLMGAVGLTVFSQVDKARVMTARTKMSQIESALEFYRMDNGRYPTSDQGLQALVQRPSAAPEPRNYPPAGYIKKSDLLVDPWGEKYLYESPGQRNGHSFDLISLGADGQPGGEDMNADITNYSDSEAPG